MALPTPRSGGAEYREPASPFQPALANRVDLTCDSPEQRFNEMTVGLRLEKLGFEYAAAAVSEDTVRNSLPRK